MLNLLTSARFCDDAPRQVWATLLDEGLYHYSPAGWNGVRGRAYPNATSEAMMRLNMRMNAIRNRPGIFHVLGLETPVRKPLDRKHFFLERDRVSRPRGLVDGFH